ncbi:MAG: carboxylesterase family protein [Hyphomicrobiales bacterium]|nr:carboxylesterase family protein [Alphaproteobacteria bacterium]MDE2283720.1 carboxylesterase family protein [Hyphomicrobiales bacterium]
MALLRNFVIVAAAAAFLCAPAAAAVQTETGLIQGVRTNGLTIYKGIPYAAPPVGELRWRAPQPPQSWKGVRKAATFAPACVQTGVSMPGERPPKISENCLYLNIWTPARSASAHLPVMVWIHGGGYSNGSASMPLYWGDQLARKGAVVVTFGYRLGPFGFLALPALTRESPHHASGNYGLLDQIAALAWIKRNIRAFGGDPDCVTIFGQSAGSDAVSILMTSPLAKGLFERAIGQSGGLFEPLTLAPNYLLKNAEQEGEAYEASLNAKSLAALRALPADELLKGTAGMITHPVLDAYVLPESPYDAFVDGKQNDVPLLLGSNEEEARSLVADLSAVTASTYDAEIVKHWGALPKPLYDQYPHATDEEARQARLDFERDLRFGWDMWAWARLEATKGKSPVFYYHFTHKPPFPKGSVYAGWGASHFAELWYMFDHLDQEPWRWTAADRQLADTMAHYWVNFARTGNPNGVGLPEWPDFRTTQHVLYLDDPVSTGGVADIKTLRTFDVVYDQARGAPFGSRHQN